VGLAQSTEMWGGGGLAVLENANYSHPQGSVVFRKKGNWTKRLLGLNILQGGGEQHTRKLACYLANGGKKKTLFERLRQETQQPS